MNLRQKSMTRSQIPTAPVADHCRCRSATEKLEGFLPPSLAEAAEVTVGYNVYMTSPDNFDQLRALSRLLRKLPRGG